MAGTPQSTKLGIKPGLRVGLVGAPDRWTLTDPPDFEPVDDGPADVLIAFVRAAAELPALVPQLAERIFPDGAFWLAWPRKAAGHVSDLTDYVVREAALRCGLVDVKVAAVDEDWSAIKIVHRVVNRVR